MSKTYGSRTNIHVDLDAPRDRRDYMHYNQSLRDWNRFSENPYGKTVVYLSVKEDENLLEQLVNRHNRPHQILKPAVEAALKAAGWYYTKLTWNPKAGCSMCPCSPGWVMTGGYNPTLHDATRDETGYAHRTRDYDLGGNYRAYDIWATATVTTAALPYVAAGYSDEEAEVLAYLSN